jgi:predicted nucleotidyltransferase
MRASDRGFFRCPLNMVLRSEGAVRILRELSRHGGALTPPTIARQTGLSNPAVNATLKLLVGTGIATTVGQGRYPAYQLDATHPLAAPLAALFEIEEARVGAVLAAVRSACRPHAPRAIWWYGSSARGADAPGSDVDIAVLLPESTTPSAVDGIRDALHPAEVAQRVTVSVVPLRPDDVRRLVAGDPWWAGLARDAIPLHGPTPDMVARSLTRGPALRRRPSQGRSRAPSGPVTTTRKTPLRRGSRA